MSLSTATRARAIGLLLSSAIVVGGSNVAFAEETSNASADAVAAVETVTGTADVVSGSSADSDSAALARTDVGVVDVPEDTDGMVTITGTIPVSIGLPDTTSADAVKDSSGTVVYANEESSTDVAVQPTTGGVRALVVIKDASAPREYRFPVVGPEGSRLVPADELLGADYITGEVFLVAEDGQSVLGTFDPAWAKDANGQPVPSHYRVEGRDLVQVVDFTADTAFPVVADPSWWSIAKCAGAIATFVGTNMISVSKLLKVKKLIADLGGIRRSAELILRASTWEERMRIGGTALVALAGEILGYSLIRNNC